jgi:hypothetical protein
LRVFYSSQVFEQQLLFSDEVEVDLTQQEMMRIAMFNWTSILLMWTLFNHTVKNGVKFTCLRVDF